MEFCFILFLFIFIGMINNLKKIIYILILLGFGSCINSVNIFDLARLIGTKDANDESIEEISKFLMKKNMYLTSPFCLMIH